MENKRVRKPLRRGIKIAAMVIGGIIMAVISGFFFAVFVKLLWNWLMPEIFGLGLIDYWQAFGLVILAKFIFGSPGGHHWHRGERRPKHDHWHYEWNDGDWEVRGGWRNWRHFDEWWKKEGKKAYEEYVENTNNENKQE